jgi:hypothetical protein
MNNSVFSSAPVLPVVIRPYPGESLSGWLQTLVDFYGLNLSAYLNRLGVPLARSKARTRYDSSYRRLTVCPEPALLQALQIDTGIGMGTLRAMTFIGIEERLRSRCLKHDWVCIACRNAASKRAERSIDLRDQRAAWSFFCPDHPEPVASRHIRSRFPVGRFCDLVRKMHIALGRAAFDSAGLTGMFGPQPGRWSVASFLAAAEYFNDSLVFEIIGFDKDAGRPSFAVVQGLQRGPWERNYGDFYYRTSFRFQNAPIMGLVFAWHILQDPSMPVYYFSEDTSTYDLLDEPRSTVLKRLLRQAREL